MVTFLVVAAVLAYGYTHYKLHLSIAQIRADIAQFILGAKK